MKSVFADTYYFLALLNEKDVAHAKAIEVSLELTCKIVTTTWVLTEVADAMAAPSDRTGLVKYVAALRDDPMVVIVPASEESFEAGWTLYAQRPDKEWSLTDSISFCVMKDNGLTEALTADKHFVQAGFKALMR